MLVGLVEQGHRVVLSSLVLYEWLRGPRKIAELSAQEEIVPREAVIPFDVEAAALAAELYTRVRAHAGRRPLDAEPQGLPRIPNLELV